MTDIVSPSSKQERPIAIRLSHVSRDYTLNRKTTVHAVSDVSLAINQGEIVALVGPSGSGKSTLMNLIGGLEPPTSGEIYINGSDVTKLSSNKLAQLRGAAIGFVFQFFYLQPFLSVARNIEVPLMFARTRRASRKSAITQALDAVGLTDHASFLPKELSGGQMQRVAVARALVNNPAIILADEPTGNLDSKNSETIIRLLQNAREIFGTTIIIVTHDKEVAAKADRIINLEDGKIHI